MLVPDNILTGFRIMITLPALQLIRGGRAGHAAACGTHFTGRCPEIHAKRAKSTANSLPIVDVVGSLFQQRWPIEHHAD
jgi:hypothetical protein